MDDLKLPQQGVTVRLTGPVPISDDEFETLRQGAVENMIFTIAAVILILWLALHSTRIIIAVMFSVLVGLAATAAAGLSLVGALNPISIAFFVLFVGIGVDFGLQFSVSYRAARYEHHGLMRSLLETAASNGGTALSWLRSRRPPGSSRSCLRLTKASPNLAQLPAWA